MGGDRIKNAKLAVKQIVNSLPANSGFNIVKYGSSPQRLFESSQQYTNENKRAALAYIEAMGSDMGGTEIFQAIKLAMCEGEEECAALIAPPSADTGVDKIAKYEEFEQQELQMRAGNDSGTYGNNQNRGWELVVKEGDNVIEVKVDSLLLEKATDCRYDALTIRAFQNGMELEEDRQILCGDYSGGFPEFRFVNKQVKIGFYSDSSVDKGHYSWSFKSFNDPTEAIPEFAPSEPTVAEATEKPSSPYYEVKQMFVITDGDIMNQEQVFQYCRENQDKMRVFSVGIGAGA